MNSTWMFHTIAKFNRDDQTCEETNILQEITKMNERNSSIKEYNQNSGEISSENYARTSVDGNGGSDKGRNENPVQATSRSDVSCLQKKDISSSSTRMYSKIALKRTDKWQENISERSKFFSIIEERSPNRKEVFNGNMKIDEKSKDFVDPLERRNMKNFSEYQKSFSIKEEHSPNRQNEASNENAKINEKSENFVDSLERRNMKNFSEYQNSFSTKEERLPNRQNEVTIDDKIENFLDRRSVRSPSKMEENDVLQNGVQNIQNSKETTVNDTLLCNPLELIEIYSNDERRNGKNNLEKRSENRENSPTRTSPEEKNQQCKLMSEKVNLSKREMNMFKEQICRLDTDIIVNLKEINERFRKNNSENTFVKSAKYEHDDVINLKRETNLSRNEMLLSDDQNDSKKNSVAVMSNVETHNNVNLITIFEASGNTCERKDDEENDEENAFETFERCENSGKFNVKDMDAYKGAEKNFPLKEPIGNCVSRAAKAAVHFSKCNEYIKEETGKEDIAKINDSLEEKKKSVNSFMLLRESKTTDVSHESGSVCSSKLSNSTKTNSSENILIERENRWKCHQNNEALRKSSVKSCVVNRSQKTMKSGETEILRDSKEEKLHAEMKDSSGMTIIIGKRESENMRVISDDRNNSRDENVRLSTINEANRKKRDPEDALKDAEAMKIDVKEDGKEADGKVESTNTCNVLTKIHERLTCDWQRMERLRMKLQCNAWPEAANWMMMLQLLDKTVTRCKSYIHGSCDSSQAESEIAKLLTRYIVDLVRVVNKNKNNLEDQERRVDQVQLESLRGKQITTKKRNILNEIVQRSNYWTNEISSLIEVISSLVKNVMADFEEKENVREERSPRKCKTTQRRAVNNSANDVKQKGGAFRSKNPKVNLIKKESTVETVLSVLEQSKSKALHTSRSPEKEKRQDDVRNGIVEKKMPDNSRHGEKGKSGRKVVTNASLNQQKQVTTRQKHRVFGNQQPVWRPGGSVRIPSSSSATTWTQKSRPTMHIKENAKLSAGKRGSSMDHILTKKNVEKIADDSGKRVAKVHNYTMEEKHGRVTNDTKKKPEIHSTKEIVSSLDIDPSSCHYKMVDKESNTSLRNTPKSKLPRYRVRNYKDTTLCDVIDREVSKESKILRALEKIIKGKPENEDPANSYGIQDEASCEYPCAIVKEIKMNEEEPTRDVDFKQFRNSNDTNETIEKLTEKSVTVSKDFVQFPTEDNNETVQGKRNFASVTSASCTVNFTSCSDYISKQSDFENRRASFNVISSALQEEKQRCEKFKKNDVSQACSSESNEKQRKCDTENSLSTDKKEKGKNFHAVSLSMLKEFLCEQGIDVDLVNRAEKYLKEKRRTQKYLKKNSASLADVPLNVAHDKIERNSNEVSLQTVFEMKDIGTCTTRYSNDSYSQTKDNSTTKSQAMETQTEMSSVKCASTECCEMKSERRNVSSMTMSLSVRDHFTETVRIPCVSISMATDCTIECNKENLGDNFTKNSNDLQNNLCKNSSNTFAKSRNITLNSMSKADRDSIEKFSLLLSRLLNQIRERCSKSLLNRKKNDETSELRHEECNRTISSRSTRQTSESETKKTNDSSVIIIPSKTNEPIRMATKARDPRKAVERKMRCKFRRLCKERKQRKVKAKKISKIDKAELRSVCNSNSSVQIIMRKKSNDKRCADEQPNVFSQTEIKSAFSETSPFGLRNNSKRERSDSEDASSTTVISSNTNFRKIELRIPTRSCSSVVLKSDEPLMELSMNELKDVKIQGNKSVKKMSTNNTRLRFYENRNKQDKNVKKFLFFSRENLLSLLYGIVCSIVFCCLQFTITCDVLS